MRIMRASEQIDGGRTIEADTDATAGHARLFLDHLKSEGFYAPRDAGIPGTGGEMDDMLYEFFHGDPKRISDVSAYLLEDWDNIAYGSRTAGTYDLYDIGGGEGDFDWYPDSSNNENMAGFEIDSGHYGGTVDIGTGGSNDVYYEYLLENWDTGKSWEGRGDLVGTMSEGIAQARAEISKIIKQDRLSRNSSKTAEHTPQSVWDEFTKWAQGFGESPSWDNYYDFLQDYFGQEEIDDSIEDALTRKLDGVKGSGIVGSRKQSYDAIGEAKRILQNTLSPKEYSALSSLIESGKCVVVDDDHGSAFVKDSASGRTVIEISLASEEIWVVDDDWMYELVMRTTSTKKASTYNWEPYYNGFVATDGELEAYVTRDADPFWDGKWSMSVWKDIDVVRSTEYFDSLEAAKTAGEDELLNGPRTTLREYGSKTASDRTFSEWKADHYPDVDLVDCSRMERSKIMNEYEEYSGGNGVYAKQSSIKTSFMNFNPSLKHRHLVAGWDWDESLNGYVASGDQGDRHFECSCGAKVASPGMASCDCGKVWNSYTVTSSDKNFMVCREVPRRDVLLAKRQGSGSPLA